MVRCPPPEARGPTPTPEGRRPQTEARKIERPTTDYLSALDSVLFNLVESNPRIVRVSHGFDGDAIACGSEMRVVELDAAGTITLGDALDVCPRLFGDVNGDGDLELIGFRFVGYP